MNHGYLGKVDCRTGETVHTAVFGRTLPGPATPPWWRILAEGSLLIIKYLPSLVFRQWPAAECHVELDPAI